MPTSSNNEIAQQNDTYPLGRLPHILYDVSLIGSACDNPHGRAGIFRAVLEIFEGLIRTNHTPTACALLSSRARYKAELFFQLEKSMNIQVMGGSAHSRLILKVMTKMKRTFLVRQISRLITDPLVRIIDHSSLESLLKNTSVYHTPMYPVPQAIRNHGISVIMTIYDLTPLLMPEWHQSETIRFFREELLPSIREDDHVVCISDATRKDLLRLRPDLSGERISVIYLAASQEKFHLPHPDDVHKVREEVGIPKGARYVLTLNTLEPRKNLGAAIQSFCRVCSTEARNDVYLVLAGAKGWLKEDLLKEVPEKMRSRIIVPGFIADELLPGLYAGSSTFLYLSHYEGFGLPPLEAMCCGATVICSNTSSLPEVVGDAALMVPPDNIEAISNELARILDTPSLQQELAKRSRERASHFSWDATAEAYYRLYERVSEKRHH